MVVLLTAFPTAKFLSHRYLRFNTSEIGLKGSKKVELLFGAVKEAELKFRHCIVNLVEKQYHIRVINKLPSKSLKLRVYK